MRSMTVIILFFSASICFPAFSPLPAGARINSMGLTSGIMRSDLFSPFINAAALGRTNGSGAAMHYTRLFGLNDLSQTSCALNIRVPFGGLGLSGQRFGTQSYMETCIHAGCGLVLIPALSVGIMSHLGQLAVGHETKNAWWLDTGFIYGLSDHLLIGFSVTNVNHYRITPDEPLPQQTRISLCCCPADLLTCCLEWVKEVRFPLEIRGGIEYCLPFIAVRAGFTDEPGRMTFGTGISLGSCRFDYALVNHSVLGNTHHVSIQIMLGALKSSPPP